MVFAFKVVNKQGDGFPLWIEDFVYPNGTVGGIIKGTWIDGSFVRTKRKDRRELEVIFDDYRKKFFDVRERAVFTFLDEKDLGDAESSRRRLDEFGHKNVTFSQLVDEFLERNPPVKSVRTGIALEWMKTDMKKVGRRQVTIDNSEIQVLSWLKSVGVEETGQITFENTEAWVLDLKVKGRTRIARKNKASVFLKSCLKKNAVARNFAMDIDIPTAEDPLTQIFDIETLQRLLDVAAETGMKMNQHLEEVNKGIMLPYFAVCMLSAVRPTECRKMTDWKYFDFDNDVIGIPEGKTISGWVRMQPNLKRILLWCKAKGLKPGYYTKTMFQKVRRLAGLGEAWTEGKNDVLRHCYASYRDAIDQNRDQLAYEMRTSKTMLRRNYLVTVKQIIAKKFEVMLPQAVKDSEM